MEELRVAFDEIRKSILTEVLKKSTSFKDAPLELRCCKDIALAAIERNGGMFKFASSELRSDPDVARVAVENNVGMFTYMSPKLKSDRSFMMSLIESSCSTKLESLVKHFDQGLRKDREVMLRAIAYCPQAFKACHSSLKNDKEFVLSAIRCSPSPLELFGECLSAKLQRDPTIGQATIESWRFMLTHVPSMPDFDTLMVGGSDFLQGECARVLRATRVNPVSIKTELARYSKLDPKHADHLNEDRLASHRRLYASMIQRLEQHHRKFHLKMTECLEQHLIQCPSTPNFGGALKSRSRSPRRRLESLSGR